MSNVLKMEDFPVREYPTDLEDLEDFPKARESQLRLAPLPKENAEPEDEAPDLEEQRRMILEEARAEAERKVQEAYTEGHRRGVEAGRAEFLESIAECESALRTAADTMVQARKDFLDSLEPQVFEMALLLGQRVLQREVQADSELVRHTAQKALSVLADRQHAVIRVHPSDLAAMKEHKLTLLDQFHGIESLEVEGDESVNPGGCAVHSETMQVDARLETLLRHVLDELTG